MKNAIIIISIVLLGQSSYCQDSDTIKPKLFNHFIGVQGNELIRQVFNFNNTTANNSNPYLLTYHINFARSGWGLRVGAAYSNRVFTTDDGITANKSNLNDLRLRFGIERAFRLSDRWSCGAGLDGIMKHDDNKTQSRVVNFDTTTTNITSLATGYGGGAMAWLRYSVSPHVLVGTEASFYYTMGNQKQNIKITSVNPFVFPLQQTTVITKTDNDFSDGVFALPVTFYLIVKF